MTKYIVKETTAFKKSFKTAKKRGRDMKKLEKLLYILANGQEIPLTYKDHQLINSKRYINSNLLYSGTCINNFNINTNKGRCWVIFYNNRFINKQFL